MQARLLRTSVRRLAFISLGLLFGLAGALSTMGPQRQAAAATRTRAATTPITHVVIFMLENHDFTNYFGQFPGVQNAVTLPHATNPLPLDLPHSGADFAAAEDGGAMDEFPALGHVQYTQSDLPTWWEYASQFGLGDNFYSSIATNSTPNHLALITAGQTGGMFATVPPIGSCGGAANNLVLSRDTSGQELFSRPCYNITANLPQLLAANNLTWRYYSPSGIFDAPSFIQSLHGSPDDVRNPNRFAQDITNGNLAAVSWVVPSSTDHPPMPVELAQNWVSSDINLLMKSSYWNNTAIFISWDDWGGQYDPVYPPQLDAYGLGARAPFLVISAYTPAGTLSHSLGEFSSFAKFIEANWQLPSLGQRDSLSQLDNLMDYFNFNQTPRAPVLVSQIAYQKALVVPVGEAGQPTNGVVEPAAGSPSTSYTFNIVYALTGTPTVHNVTIDGKTYAMSSKNAVKGGTLWQYTATGLAVGSHTCTFTFSTPSGLVTFPDNGTQYHLPVVHPFSLTRVRVPSTVLPDQPVTFSVKYRSPQGKAPTLADIELDGVPHTMTKTGGTNYSKGVTYSYTTTLAAGDHHERYSFDDGSGVWNYDSDQVTVTPLTLTGSGFSPSSGSTSTTFTFSTTYTDGAGAAPSQAQIFVDGTAYPMSYISGSYASGALFQAQMTLASGKHTFYFVFADAASSWADPLGPAVYAGPTVTIHTSPASTSSTATSTATAPEIIAPSHDVDPDYPLPDDSDG